MCKMRIAGYTRCHVEGRKKGTRIGGEARMLDDPHKFPYVGAKRCAMHFDIQQQ